MFQQLFLNINFSVLYLSINLKIATNDSCYMSCVSASNHFASRDRVVYIIIITIAIASYALATTYCSHCFYNML